MSQNHSRSSRKQHKNLTLAVVLFYSFYFLIIKPDQLQSNWALCSNKRNNGYRSLREGDSINSTEDTVDRNDYTLSQMVKLIKVCTVSMFVRYMRAMSMSMRYMSAMSMYMRYMNAMSMYMRYMSAMSMYMRYMGAVSMSMRYVKLVNKSCFV